MNVNVECGMWNVNVNVNVIGLVEGDEGRGVRGECSELTAGVLGKFWHILGLRACLSG